MVVVEWDSSGFLEMMAWSVGVAVVVAAAVEVFSGVVFLLRRNRKGFFGMYKIDQRMR
jgi:hypothetical protein